MPHYTQPVTKIIKGLKKASKTHANPARSLSKIRKDQKKRYNKKR